MTERRKIKLGSLNICEGNLGNFMRQARIAEERFGLNFLKDE
jgi:hypothetical protein